MGRPLLRTRIEQGDYLLLRKQYSSYVRTFMLIAMRASEGKVAILISTAMFDTNNVVDFEGKKGVVYMHTAVFATKIGPFCHEPLDRFWDVSSHSVNMRFALALARLMSRSSAR